MEQDRPAGKIYSTTKNTRQQLQCRNDRDKVAAGELGLDTADWFEVKYTLSTADLLWELTTRLDEYQEFFPQAASYVESVKAFYAAAEAGECAVGGLVVVGTKDDLPHPVLEVGDIVVARNGRQINSVEQFQAAASTDSDVLEFYRNFPAQHRRSENVPATEVLVGFLPMKVE